MGCGICGFVGLDDKQLLKSMCETIRHRGPDHTDYFLDSKVGLGIDRLSIIDLETGDQPIHNEDGTLWIVYNGETYNYVELMADLEARGHRFYTKSDTEAVVHAYEEWGNDCVLHLRGMYAFAIWDSRKRRLYLARDRFGKKPLYYATVGNVFLFASEIKAILQYGEVRRRVNPAAIDHFFTYMYVPSPMTIFEGIHKLPPGHYAVYEEGVLTTAQYWEVEFSPDPAMTEDGIVDALYAQLEQAVKLRLRSDVPVGAFLSGGIDSSTVAAMMSRLSETPIKTVSIGFSDGASELAYARQVAEFLGTEHREHIVTPDAYKILPRLVHHFDEPFADHSMIPTYYVSEVTRREVKVALSGDGGDELFMGYDFLDEPIVYNLYLGVPRPVRRFALRTLMSLPVKGEMTRMAQHAYEKDYGGQSPAERFIMRVTVNNEQGLKRLYSDELLSHHTPVQTYSYLRDFLNRYSSSDPLIALDYATIKGYLEEDILPKVDRMSMAVSLEVRCPLLDQELVALVERIPPWLKMKGHTKKYIMKKMVVKRKLLPSSIALRKKQGFGAPIDSWFKDSWKQFSAQLLDPIVSSNYTGLFDRQYVRRLLDEPYLNSSRLFALITFVLWYKEYMERAEIRPTQISSTAA
jgi:asparagine synthase (glutamine-hydrolysing)